MTTVYTEECGQYVLDIDGLIKETHRAITKVLTQTAWDPCAIDLHADDADLVVRRLLQIAADDQIDWSGGVRMMGIPLLRNESANRRRGVAQVQQCPLPHPTPQDCPYHAQTTRRLVSRDIPMSIDLPGQILRRVGYVDLNQHLEALPCKYCRHHPSYHVGTSGCVANVGRNTAEGVVYGQCGCAGWVAS